MSITTNTTIYTYIDNLPHDILYILNDFIDPNTVDNLYKERNNMDNFNNDDDDSLLWNPNDCFVFLSFNSLVDLESWLQERL